MHMVSTLMLHEKQFPLHSNTPLNIIFWFLAFTSDFIRILEKKENEIIQHSSKKYSELHYYVFAENITWHKTRRQSMTLMIFM